MNKTILSIAAGAAFVGTQASAEIVLTDSLSAYGYLDVAADRSDFEGSDFDARVAEFELGFHFQEAESPVFATVELSYKPDAVQDTYDFETAVIGYQVNEELVLTAGNILSYQGFETFDATGLYQISYAYRGINDDNGNNLGQRPLYDAYAVGAAADYATDAFALGAWVGDDIAGEAAAFEFLAAYTGVENLTLKAIYAHDDAKKTYNVWASYEIDAITLAAEYIYNDMDDNSLATGVADTQGWLIMANYAAEKWGVTGRISSQKDEDIVGADNLKDWYQYTLSPSYVFSDNLVGLLEYSRVNSGVGENGNYFGAELLYTF